MPIPPHRAASGHALRAVAALRTGWRAVHARGPACLVVLLLYAAGVAAANAVQLPRQASPAPPAISLEYAVKATYLYKLAPFVNWPPEEFASPDVPFRICVVGDDPFRGFLADAVVGRRFGTHAFEVLRLDALTADAGCQIAFIGQLPVQTMRQALAAVDGKPVLTVVDSATPDEQGIVQFVIRQGRVGFEINIAAAARNHLTISSKLLSLALKVNSR